MGFLVARPVTALCEVGSLARRTICASPIVFIMITPIFSLHQDLDIVVDGTAAQAQAFEQRLKSSTRILRPKANQWEVRPLRESRGDKGAILDDHGLMNQHTTLIAHGGVTRPKPASRARHKGLNAKVRPTSSKI